jgi:hypothetical protein
VRTPVIQTKAKKYFGWMEWIIKSNLPFTFVEDEWTRIYTNLEPICTKTLMKMINLVSEQLVSTIYDTHMQG